jgi:hypothetical protein
MPTPPKTLSADAFLSYTPKTKMVDIPSLGGKIEVREALASDDEFIAGKLTDDSTTVDVRVWLLIRCVLSPSFTEDQFDALKGLPNAVLTQVDEAIDAAGGGKAVSAKAAEKSAVA